MVNYLSMRLLHALDDAFAGRSVVRVVRALNELPDGLSVSARELARRSGLSHPTVSSVLASLIEQGVVLARRAPRGDGFELNRRHALVEKLQPLFEWEGQLLREFAGFIATEIQRQAPQVSSAYLFGSAVRGQMSPGSDIDLAATVLDPDTSRAEAALAEVADAVRVRYGNRLDVTIGPSPIDQLQRPGRPGYRFWASVAKEGIALLDRTVADEPKLKKRRSAHG